MKKILAFLLVAVMLLSFASCKEDGSDNTSSTASKADSENASADASATASTPVVDPDFKVGVIHIGDPADGSGYSFAHDEGIKAMQTNLGLADDQIVRELNVDDTDAASIKSAIEDAIVKGCKIIFATSYGYMDTCAELAEEYPDVIFSHGTGYKSNTTNFNNYFGRIYQARYLAGIAAGLKTVSDKIGYVSAYGTSLAETCSGINAFALGVQSVNPDAQVFVKILDSWYAPDNETAFAQALIESGCDVIAQHCDTANPQIAAQEKNVFGCGYNSDMTPSAPKAHLTAPIWHWGVYYTAAVKAAMEDKWAEFGNYYAGIKEGFVDVSPLSENCAENTQAYIDQVVALFNDSSWDVFSGVKLSFDAEGKLVKTDAALLKADDSVIVEAGGASVEDGVIQGTMNYYVKGVQEN